MPDAIFITQSQTLGFGGAIINPHSGSFDVNYIRVRETEELDVLVRGGVPRDLPEGAVLESGEVFPPNGTPPSDFEDGRPVTSSFKEAFAIATAALINPQSVLATLGFRSDTPVYFGMPGQPAERFNPEDDLLDENGLV
jgi:hypothetical protein